MKLFLGIMDCQQETRVKIIECDRELFSQRRIIRDHLESKYIKIEPSAPNTQAQNGGAERVGSDQGQNASNASRLKLSPFTTMARNGTNDCLFAQSNTSIRVRLADPLLYIPRSNFETDGISTARPCTRPGLFASFWMQSLRHDF